MQLLTTKHFNSYALDCYVEPEETSDFWATREQIGTLLEYAEPDTAIRVIHSRNKERLDKFSTSIKLIRVEGNREVERDVTVYSFKGLLEICRYSQQPNANAVMDWLWDVADEIRRTGSYSLKKERPALPSGVMEGARMIFEVAGIKDNQLSIALDKIYTSYTGQSALKTGEVTLVAPTNNQLLNPTDIGQHFGVSAQKINNLLVRKNYQRRLPNGKYEPLELGEPYAVMLDTGKHHSDGTPVRQLKWDSGIIDELEQFFPQLPF